MCLFKYIEQSINASPVFRANQGRSVRERFTYSFSFWVSGRRKTVKPSTVSAVVFSRMAIVTACLSCSHHYQSPHREPSRPSNKSRAIEVSSLRPKRCSVVVSHCPRDAGRFSFSYRIVAAHSEGKPRCASENLELRLRSARVDSPVCLPALLPFDVGDSVSLE